MNNTARSEASFDIKELAMITGLTDRTLRNYIASGVLRGEKVNGVWRFNEEQVQSFVSDPAVYPSLLAKRNAAIFDFLKDTDKPQSRCCVILDMPKDKSAGMVFCREITEGNYSDLSFYYDSVKGVPRVIACGDTDEVLDLVSRCREKIE